MSDIGSTIDNILWAKDWFFLNLTGKKQIVKQTVLGPWLYFTQS